MIMLVFAVLIIFLAVDFAIDKKWLSPLKIFNGIWLLVLVLYSFELSYVQEPFNDKTVQVFLVCVATFDIVYYSAKKFLKEPKKKDKKTKKEDIVKKKINFHGLEQKLKIINISFIILFGIEIIYSGYLPMLSLAMGRGSEYLNFGIPSVNGLMYALATCLGAYYIFKKDPRALIYFGFGVLIVSRQLLMSMIIEAIILFACFRVHHKNKIRHLWLKVVAVVVVVFAGFTVLGNARSGSDEMQNIFEPRAGYEGLPTSVMWIYSYLEFSLSNFNNLTSYTSGAVNFGSSAINAFLPTVIARQIKLPNNFEQNYLMRLNFNVSTWFPEVYLDFGIVGVGVFSGLVALLGWALYRNILKKESIRDYLLYAVYLHNILLFFFINMFLYLPVVAQFAIIPLIFKDKDER